VIAGVRLYSTPTVIQVDTSGKILWNWTMSKDSQTGAIPNSIYPLSDSLYFLAGTNSSSNYWFAEIGLIDSTKSIRIITSKSPGFRKRMDPVSYSMYDSRRF
jgi:hypothetical protein